MLLGIDVRRAYFCAKTMRRVHVLLPEGDGGGPGSQQCWLLRKSLYGIRDTAQNWKCELGVFLEEIGLRRGKASTDVTVKASRDDAEWVTQIGVDGMGWDQYLPLSGDCENQAHHFFTLPSTIHSESALCILQGKTCRRAHRSKTQMIGEAADLNKQLQILNTTVQWSSGRLWVEGEPRHVKESGQGLGTRRRMSSPPRQEYHPGERPFVEDKEGSIDPELGPRSDHHVPCGRGEAEKLLPRPAEHLRWPP